MKICGVIVEYNPFHNGHRYHLQNARKLSQADVVVAVMSGNFLQRGEPAILDKWQRANAALNNGADLVIELPFCWSVQSADYFAQGGVQLLQQIGCNALCFGTDSQHQFDYQKFGVFVQQNTALIAETFHSLADSTLNYPQKMTAVFQQIYPDNQLDVLSPNHILGLSYAKENARYASPMELVPLPRKAANYHDQTAGAGEIASATAIRKLLFEKKTVASFVPRETAWDLSHFPQVIWENLWPYLKYQIIASDIKDLQKIYQMSEGLEYLVKKMAGQAASFAEFIESLKSKRYTWVRLQRLCVYLLGQVTATEVEKAQKNQQLRVLGFTQRGQQLLKEKSELPWLSRFGKESGVSWELTDKTDQIYQLADSKISEQNFGRPPLRIQEN